MDKWTYINGVLTLSSIFEEGGFEIEIELGEGDHVTLYEIPNFGGERRFLKEYNSTVEAIEAGRKLT